MNMQEANEKNLKQIALGFGQTLNSCCNQEFSERVMKPYKKKVMQNDNTKEFYKLQTNKLSDQLRQARTESRSYRLSRNAGVELQHQLTKNIIMFDKSMKTQNYYSIYNVFYGDLPGLEHIRSDYKIFHHEKLQELDYIKNDTQHDLEAFLKKKYNRRDKFIGVQCKKTNIKNFLIENHKDDLDKPKKIDNIFDGYAYKFNKQDYTYGYSKSNMILPIYKKSSSKSSTVVDLRSFIRKPPNIKYDIYLESLEFDKVCHRNAISYQLLELREHSNFEEYFFKSLEVVNSIIDYFISEINFLLTDYDTAIPWALIDGSKLYEIISNHQSKNTTDRNNTQKDDSKGMNLQKDKSFDSENEDFDNLKNLIKSKKSSALNKEKKDTSRTIEDPSEGTKQTKSANAKDRADTANSNDWSKFTVPTLVGNVNKIKKKFQVIFHDIFDDFSKTFIWIVHNYEVFKDYNILLWNYPGQPLTVFNEEKEFDNYSLCTIIDEVMGCLDEKKILDLQSDIIYFAGFGFGCNIALSYVLQQSDSNFIKALILENGFYDMNQITVQEYIHQLQIGFETDTNFKHSYLLTQALTGRPEDILDKDLLNRNIQITPMLNNNRLFLLKHMQNQIDITQQCDRIKNRLYVIHSKMNTITRFQDVMNFFDRCTSSKQKEFVITDLYPYLINDNGRDLGLEFKKALRFFENWEANTMLKAFYTGFTTLNEEVVSEYNKNMLLAFPIKKVNEVAAENETSMPELKLVE